jgi:orotate phosphoribosyltransferase
MTINEQKKKLLQIITKDAYVKGKIILSSGKESDYYIDARRVTLIPEGVYYIANIMLDMVKDMKIDAIGGPTLGADPMIGALSVLSYQSGKPLNTFIIRSAAKAHGRQQQVEGPIIKPGSKVVIIDDVATTGKAFLHSLDVLSSMDVIVDHAICIVDRNDGAKEALAEKGCKLLSIFNINEIHK